MKGKRFLAGFLAAAVVLTSPAVTRASLVDDDLVDLTEVETTEETNTEKTIYPQGNSSGSGGTSDDSGGKSYDTNWDKLKDEISNAISTFSLDDEEEPVEEEASTKAVDKSEYGGDRPSSIFTAFGKYQVNWVGASNYYWSGTNQLMDWIQARGEEQGIQFYKNAAATSYENKYSQNTANTKRKAAAARALGLSESTSNTKAAKEIYNSTTRNIEKGDSKGIYKAYLVWQTRGDTQTTYFSKNEKYGKTRKNKANTVALVRPDGTAKKVTADKEFKDVAPGGGQILSDDGKGTEGDADVIHSMYCYYADITSFVKKDKNGGYGDYSVCNIRPWDPDGHGASSECRWQLIFVEKRYGDTISAVSINLGSYFPYPPDGTTDDNPAKVWNTKVEGLDGVGFTSGNKVSVLFGCSNDTSGDYHSLAKVKLTKDGSVASKNIDIERTVGLYNNDKRLDVVNNKGGYEEVVFSLKKTKLPQKDNKDLKNGDLWLEFYTGDEHWKRYFLTGYDVEYNFPFDGTQTTTVTNETTGAVTVSNSGITNKVTAGDGKLGIHSGTITVELDSKLSVNKKSDGSWDISHNGGSSVSVAVDGNTVVFSGVDLKTKGKKFTYSINCTAAAQGRYENSDDYSGKLWNGNLASDKRATGTNMGIVYTGNSSAEIKITEVSVRYHLNALNGEASMEILDDGKYDTVTGVLIKKTGQNDSGTMKHPYSILDYDEAGFTASEAWVAEQQLGNPVWRSNADGTGVSYSGSTTIYPSEDMDLYAHWLPKAYNVVYDANGGTGSKLGGDGGVLPLHNGRQNTGVDTAYRYEDYALLGADNFTRPGYYFTGWNSKADGTGVHYEAGDTDDNWAGNTSQERIFYAQWEPRDEYEVQYVDGMIASDGDPVPTNFNTAEFYQSMEKGEDAVYSSGGKTTTIRRIQKDTYPYQQDTTIPDISLEARDGYTFVGWAPQEVLREFVDQCENATSQLENARRDFDSAYDKWKSSSGASGGEQELKNALDEYNRAYDEYQRRLSEFGNLYRTGQKVCCLPLGSNGCSSYQKPDGTKVVTLCAVWIKDIQAEIIYSPGTGIEDEIVGSMETQKCTLYEYTVVAKNQFMRSLHRFIEWKEFDDHYDRTYKEGASIRADKGITLLVAQWIADETIDDKVIFVSYRGDEQGDLGESNRREKVKNLVFPEGEEDDNDSSSHGSSGGSSGDEDKVSEAITFPEAESISGWTFDGWVEISYAKQYWKDSYEGITSVVGEDEEEDDSEDGSSNGGHKIFDDFDDGSGSSGGSSEEEEPVWSSESQPGLYKAGTKMRFKKGTVFYAQYSKDNHVYFVQQKEIQTKSAKAYRGSFRINLFEIKDKITVPKQIIKNGWTAMGWTREADCMATVECYGDQKVIVKGDNVYYGLYQKSITISYDSNGYDPVSAMPAAQTATAYYTTAGWDKLKEASYPNAARQYATNNEYLNAWFARTGEAVDRRKATDRGYVFPSFTIADLVQVYRKAGKRETDVVPVVWCTDSKGSKEDVVEDKSWLDVFRKQVNCVPAGVYEFREDAVLYQQYKTVTLDDGEKIRKEVSILAGDTIGIGDWFVHPKLSDTGRVYVSGDHGIATVTQRGVVTGVSNGVVTITVYASDGKTEVGTCIVTVSTAAVRIPRTLTPGKYAEVGIEVRAGGNKSLTGTLSMAALSGLSGRNTGEVYSLNAYSRSSGGSYSLLSEGSVVVKATANAWNGGKAEKTVDFKVEPVVSLEMLAPDQYDATVVWKLDLKLN